VWEKINKFRAKEKEESSKYLMEDGKIQVQFKKIKDEELNEETLFILFTDISIVKKLEEARAESKYKEMLMTTITHELRTPTTSTLSMLELMKTKPMDKEGQDYIQMAINSCLLLLNLISDIMVHF
jgi:signal transduction histidine kinase